MIGDSENLPFAKDAFDVVVCTNSFHHYPNPQAFINEAARVLKPYGRLVLRDYTSNKFMVWLMNHIEMPLAHLVGHGDVPKRLKGPHSKCGRPGNRCEGSNPSISALSL